jgi:hypothetical protein
MKKLKCCPDMEAAQESGTDNEGFGPLVYRSAEDIFFLGCDLPALKFCPWCGKRPKEVTGP